MSSGTFRNLALSTALVCLSWPLAVCGATGVPGIYSNPGLVLELHPDGKCSISAVFGLGDKDPDICTYKVDGNKITVSANRNFGTEVFTIHGDGSLTAQMWGTLQKTK